MVADLIHVQDMTGKVATSSEEKKGQYNCLLG